MRRAGLVLLGLLVTVGAPLRAQDRQGDVEADLQATAERVADLWSSGDLAGLGDLLLQRGIRFHAGTGSRETLEPRKTVAALEDLLSRRRTASARVARVATAEGSPDRGSAEIVWEAVAPGTSEVLRYTLFVGLLREESRWRVYEIRVLP